MTFHPPDAPINATTAEAVRALRLRNARLSVRREASDLDCCNPVYFAKEGAAHLLSHQRSETISIACTPCIKMIWPEVWARSGFRMPLP
jgi:hypothetical protein